jgi:Tol biopolymer transport system component
LRSSWSAPGAETRQHDAAHAESPSTPQMSAALRGLLDRFGKRLSSLGGPFPLEVGPVLSPDGTRAVVAAFADGNIDLWLHDIVRDVRQRLTSDPFFDTSPVWSGDGKRIAFASNRSGKYDLYQLIPGSGTPEELIYHSDENKFPVSWSGDGRFLLYSVRGVSREIWALPMDGAGKRTPVPVLQTPANESAAVLSPDSRWIAYVSDESGAAEVYVQRFMGGPVTGMKVLVSKGGGSSPRWRGDGRELLYLGPRGALTSVPVTPGETFVQGAPQVLFSMTSTIGWAVAADGKRFLSASYAQRAAPEPFTVVLNWQK